MATTIPHPRSHAQPSPDPTVNIHVLKMRLASGAGALRCFADVAIGDHLIIRDFRVVQQAGQEPWVAPPSREYLAPDGRKKYAPICELTGSLKVGVERAVLAAWEGGAR
jgi:DNA-binding cell septation regulator SpoVG